MGARIRPRALFLFLRFGIVALFAGATSQVFELLLELLELGVLELFEVEKSVVRALSRTDQFVKLNLERACVTVLCVLDQKDREEGQDRSSRVDDELPRIAVVEDGAGQAPHQDQQDGDSERDRRADRVRDPSCGPLEKRFL